MAEANAKPLEGGGQRESRHGPHGKLGDAHPLA